MCRNTKYYRNIFRIINIEVKACKKKKYYFILFYFILFYFILFYFILSYFILFHFILFYFILFYLDYFISIQPLYLTRYPDQILSTDRQTNRYTSSFIEL